MEQARQMLQHHFGYDTFRQGQAQIIEQTLRGQSSLCVMPTGGGKSICYQIPALMLEGLTIVISPLISLMQDQVEALRTANIPAAYINSTLTAQEVDETMQLASAGYLKLLYIAPERLESTTFLQALSNLSVPLLAIDEAHCISQWGHDFRPSYRSIHKLFTLWPQKPTVLALTATATPTVCDDIRQLLAIDEQATVMTGFSRENLALSVLIGENKERYVKNYVQQNKQEVGIIYAATRKAVDAIYDVLSRSGEDVAKYHAGLSENLRMAEQERFLKDEARIMVATNAFGMGIDKSNVRFVLHYQMPRNMESYYQEAGRAGRDGLPSACILLYASGDVQTQRFLIEQSQDEARITQELAKLQTMVDYCHTEGCLQNAILAYFGEVEEEPCGRCSNCIDGRAVTDVTEDAQKVLACVVRMGQKFGKTMVAQVLIGSKNQKIAEFGFARLSTYGILKGQYASKDVSNFIEFLIAEGLLAVKHGTFPTIYVSAEGKEVLLGNRQVMRKEAVTVKKLVDNDPLFEHLRVLRKEIADEEKVPPFVVFSDKTLRDLCDKRPTVLEDLRQVSGIGEVKFEKYGQRFFDALQSFLEASI
ncbi:MULTISPECIES: DNA helicase RecQ [Lysinibacillus]|uniref:DNA helicase RecQ n=1 Tax=Lysinibacillus TaxID=400634 RepID=UPI001C8B34A7|nr:MULTISPECIES: DNA helicase RecQ [Lysinibacillus]WHP42820.1 DNA helicase RecQ [Lysinibacillus boronitolerans]MBX8945449.1 DNA helicase RecQ [Lysinibacillus sp. K60]MED3798328.1 DNA helicase RecQ [Lysinibacillus capsici]UUV26847.1 DNA helicase RecQ [Lysinibacillus sp. FN11]UYB49739.1 DNA helicase RecQ [Lysinibacillus capsici]